MPLSVVSPKTFGGTRRIKDDFNPAKKGQPKFKGTGAPPKFTGKRGDGNKPKAIRRVQKLTKPPMKIKGAQIEPGKKRVTGHSMGGMFGFGPKKPAPDNMPPKQSTRKDERAARTERLRNLKI